MCRPMIPLLTKTSRVLYAWENTHVPVDEVVNDILRAFHHPALRHDGTEIQRDMFNTVRKWADEHPRRNQLDHILSSESVKKGKNQILNQQGGTKSGGGGHDHGHSHGAFGGLQLGHGKVAGSLWDQVRTRDMDTMAGRDGDPAANYESTSPAPVPNYHPPGQQSYDYQQNPPYQGGGPGGYNAPEPQGYYGQPPPPPGPQYGYGAPPPGQWGGPQGGPPPQPYGGPAYGAPPPQYPPYGQPPPPQEPPGWNQYPGARHGY